jgi:hypothetical protein
LDSTNFDAWTRIASRRGSLLALGGVGLASALSGPFGAVAKPKAGKLARKKVKAKCKAQVGQCETVLNIACADDIDPDAYREAFLPCCDFLATCNAGAMLECQIAGGV